MFSSWENILRSYGGVFCFFAKHIVEHLDFNVRFNSDFCEKSSSLMMVKKMGFYHESEDFEWESALH